MSQRLTLSPEELANDHWQDVKRFYDARGWDWMEAVHNIARFRLLRAEARAKALSDLAAKNPPAAPPAPAQLVHFNTVRQHWDAKAQRWTKPGIVYIGRTMPHMNMNLPASPFANQFRIDKDTDTDRENAIELYADWLVASAQAALLRQLDSLRGQTLVCWCKSAGPGLPSRACHGDILLQLMREKDSYADWQLPESKPVDDTSPVYQPALHMRAF